MLPIYTSCAPNKGIIVAVLVNQNELVQLGQPLLIIEAMKMQTTLCAEVSGKVNQVFVGIGDDCLLGMPLLDIQADGANQINTTKVPNTDSTKPVSYTPLRAHETVPDLVCRLLLDKN